MNRLTLLAILTLVATLTTGCGGDGGSGGSAQVVPVPVPAGTMMAGGPGSPYYAATPTTGTTGYYDPRNDQYYMPGGYPAAPTQPTTGLSGYPMRFYGDFSLSVTDTSGGTIVMRPRPRRHHHRHHRRPWAPAVGPMAPTTANPQIVYRTAPGLPPVYSQPVVNPAYSQPFGGPLYSQPLVTPSTATFAQSVTAANPGTSVVYVYR